MDPMQIMAATIVALILTAMIVAIGRETFDGARGMFRSHQAARSARHTDLLHGDYRPDTPQPHLSQARARRYRRLARLRLQTVGELAALRDRRDRRADEHHLIPFFMRWMTRRAIDLRTERIQRLERKLELVGSNSNSDNVDQPTSGPGKT